MLICIFCEYNTGEFKLACCEKDGKHIYVCKPCLHYNYKGMKIDSRHPKRCNFCKNEPHVKLI